jgi:kynurenine 3-monooxygenase
MSRFTIIGAGLAGSLMALYLAREGFAVQVLERRPEAANGAASRGRSINLTLATRGLHVLEQAGCKEEVLRQAILLEGRMVHGRDGRAVFHRYGVRSDERLYSVSRCRLNAVLLDEARRAGARVSFGKRLLRIEPDALDVRDDGTGEIERISAEYVIGADGACSTVRAHLARRPGFHLQQEPIPWAYKELNIPPHPRGGWRLDQHALHVWPRQDALMVGMPNLDGSFTCPLFLPFDGARGFSSLSDEAAVRAFFRAEFANAATLMDALAEEFASRPVSSLTNIRCWPWREGRIVLLGDACHAVVPFYGQGMNAAFEDCLVLLECLRKAPPERAFERYAARRKADVDALSELSLDNFAELRSHVSSPLWRARRAAEHALYRMFPATFVPLYNMVSFTRRPYSQALREARRRHQMLNGMAAGLLLGAFGVAALRTRRK